MADEIVVRYDADVKKLEDKLKSIEKEQLAVDKAAKNSGQSITDGANNSTKALGKVEKQTVSLKNTFNDLAQHLPFAGAIQQVNSLTGSIVNTGKAVSGLSGAMRILKVAIASTGIGLLVTAFASLVAYFKSTEEGGDRLAKVMRVLGALFEGVVRTISTFGEFLFDVGEAIVTFGNSSEKATQITDDYKKSVSQLASEIADLEDKLSALSITLELQNDKLQTAIEVNLKSLRNRNITLGESKDLIFDIAKLETERLQNNNLLLDGELEKERKSFILKTGLNTNLEGRLKREKELLEVVQKSGAIFTEEEAITEKGQVVKIKRLEEEIKKQNEKKVLFDKFIKSEIDADTFLNKAKGTFQEEDVKRIADLLHKKEAANREALLLEERLQNFEDAAVERDRANQEKIRAEHDKTFQDKLKRLDLEEKLALGVAKIEERSQDNLIFIEQQFNQKKIELFQANNKTREAEYQELLLNQRKLEKDYTDFLSKEEAEREKERERIAQIWIKEKEKDNKVLMDLEEEMSRQATELAKASADETTKKEKEKAEEIKAIRKQALNDTIALTTQALNSINDLQLARTNAQIEEERSAQQKITDDRIAAIDTRAKAGVISETQAASQKAKIQRDAQKKEAELKKRQFEAEQKASINRINISTAEAVVKTLATYGFTPLAAIAIAGVIAAGELQKSFVRAQPVPKFKDGVIDLKGKGTGTSDSIPSMLSKGESVMTAKETKQYKPLFESIREGYFDKYADYNFVQPALKKERERNKLKEERDKQAHEYMKSLTMNGLLDTSHLERLTKKNKSVNINNPEVIKDAIEKGMEKAFKNRRGL